jgi:hypothetical protein
MNVASPHWASIHAAFRHPLNAALCSAFQLSKPVPPEFERLLHRLGSGRAR